MQSPASVQISPLVRAVRIIQEFSLPLIAGVVLGLIAANVDHHWYETLVEFNVGELLGTGKVLGHKLTLHFIVNGMFMCLFFGIAAKEITQAALPGGVLNPLRRAINPLFGTMGGIFGPAGMYLALAWVFYGATDDFGAVAKGWAIPTATDIALAWLAARIIFGPLHPAVNFLLLLAVADDAIGLVIIAAFYPDPSHPIEPLWLLLVVGGMAAVLALRLLRVQWWPAFIVIGGAMSWAGLAKAGVEPALALVPIVPFLPSRARADGHSANGHSADGHSETGADAAHQHSGHHGGHSESALDRYEHQTKLFVDFGLFLFAFINAGVAFSNIGWVTMMILMSLIVGKAIGITLFSWVASLIGFPMPDGMNVRHLLVTAIIAGLGLTVALFIADKAFALGTPGAAFGEPAKMGAVFSIGSALVAYVLAVILRVKWEGSMQLYRPSEPQAGSASEEPAARHTPADD